MAQIFSEYVEILQRGLTAYLLRHIIILKSYRTTADSFLQNGRQGTTRRLFSQARICPARRRCEVGSAVRYMSRCSRFMCRTGNLHEDKKKKIGKFFQILGKEKSHEKTNFLYAFACPVPVCPRLMRERRRIHIR